MNTLNKKELLIGVAMLGAGLGALAHVTGDQIDMVYAGVGAVVVFVVDRKLTVGALGLLETNPFPNRPPKWIRASLFDYHFTTPAQRGKTGDWWTRKYLRLYMPPVALVP